MFWGINDYELLYLINEYNEKALNLMFEKYSAAIKNTIYSLKVPTYYLEEFMQEGLMVLVTAIKTFKDYYGKTFYKYFEVLLRRHYYKLFDSLNVYNCMNNIEYDDNIYTGKVLSETDYSFYNIFPDNPLRQKILRSIFLENCSPKKFAELNKVSCKKVYNEIFLIKKYLKKFYSL